MGVGGLVTTPVLAEVTRAWGDRSGLSGFSPAVLHLALTSWTRLHGVISLELGGHLAAAGIDPGLVYSAEVTAIHRAATAQDEVATWCVGAAGTPGHDPRAHPPRTRAGRRRSHRERAVPGRHPDAFPGFRGRLHQVLGASPSGTPVIPLPPLSRQHHQAGPKDARRTGRAR